MQKSPLNLLVAASLAVILPSAHSQQTPPGYGSEHPDWVTALGLWAEFKDEFRSRFYREISDDEIEGVSAKVDAKGFGARFLGYSDEADSAGFEDLLARWSGHGRMSPYDLTERAIPQICELLDPFSGYITARDSEIIDELRVAPRGGVGMTLERDDEGRLVCFPYPGGPAAGAGLRFGDVLLAVDGRSVDGASHWEAALAILGEPGTAIAFTVRHSNGIEETLEIIRAESVPSQVLVEETPVGITLKIRDFGEGVGENLRDTLKSLDPGKRISIDLRGNQGGQLRGAVLAASLFLPQDAVIGYLETRNGTQTFLSGNPVFYEPGLITLLVNEQTASGAELFAAALLAAPDLQVLIYGGSTFGKGVVVDRVRLASGGFLNVTSGRLFDPKKRSWNATGLATFLQE